MIDFELLGQVSSGEGAAYAVGGGVFTVLVTLLIKQGFRVVVGKDPGGNGVSNGKAAKSQYCPSHDEFSRKLDERQEVLKTALASITRNQDSQQKLLLTLASAMRASTEQVKSLASDVSDVKQAIQREQIVEIKTRLENMSQDLRDIKQLLMRGQNPRGSIGPEMGPDS